MAFSLEDYADIREIGRGGMGRVYLATQRSLSRTVVIKEMAPALVADAAQVKRFENEAKAAAALDHPNIIRIYDFGSDRDSFYIVMEYVDGPDLEQLFARQDIPMEVRLMVVLQALKGLHYAHRQNIIHRDVKPGNILVATNGQAKVVDFGLAYAGSQVLHLTATEAIVGTPQYMSPEQANGSDVKDPRMDVFSAGVVLYRTLSGRLPFAGTTIPTVLYNITQTQEQHIQTLVPTVPDDLAAALHRALTKDPEERLPDLSPLIETIQKFVYEAGFADPVEAVHRCMTDPMAGAAEVYRRMLDYHLRMANHWASKVQPEKVKAHAKEVVRYDPTNREVEEIVRRVATATTVLRLFRRTSELTTEAALLARHRPRRRLRVTGAVLLAAALVGAAGLGGYRVLRMFGDERPAVPAGPPNDSDRDSLEIAVVVPQGSADSEAQSAVVEQQPARVLPQAPSPSSPVGSGARTTRTQTQVSRFGTVRLHLDPPDARVEVDGRLLRGSGANREVRLEVGRHRLEVSADGYETYGRWFTVERGVQQSIDVALRKQVVVGTLHVHTYPYGELWVDGRYCGTTPTNPPLELTPGRHSVAVHRPGYHSYETMVEIKAGQRINLKAELVPEAGPLPRR